MYKVALLNKFYSKYHEIVYDNGFLLYWLLYRRLDVTGYNYVVTENNIYVHLREHLEERSKPEFVVSL